MLSCPGSGVSPVPEWIPDTRRFATLAEEVGNDDISGSLLANREGLREEFSPLVGVVRLRGCRQRRA
jgi:hypothetical protein